MISPPPSGMASLALIDQIHDDLLDQAGVGLDVFQVTGACDDQVHVFTDDPPQHLFDLLRSLR